MPSSLLWKSDDELFSLARRELFSAVVGDVMDKMGLQQQFLPPQIQPLDPRMVLVGRAMPVLEADFYEGSAASRHPLADRPFGLMLEALDDLQAGEVYVCTGGSPRYALWGELMSTRAMHCGAAGAVLDGYSRDTKGILALGFLTFSYGSYAQDQGPRGKVIDFRVAIRIGQARIEPGDILVGDLDGVCVVPRCAEEQVFMAAMEKVRAEKTVQKALQEGMTAREAFDRYGVL
jgi:regulator of RNase E activity RraA